MTVSNATDELRRMLDERGVEYKVTFFETFTDTEWCVNDASCTYTDLRDTNSAYLTIQDITPEQAIAVTLDDGEYECKMDALLCYLTNGKFSKSRQYSLDFMKSCVDEEYEAAYATLGRGECEKDEPDGWYKCNECGCVVGYWLLVDDSWTIYMDDYQIPFNNCPNCGRKVQK